MYPKPDYTYRIDDTDPNGQVIGTASVGAVEGNTVWQIKKVSVVGVITTVKYALGNNKFDKSWTGRGALVYL